MREERLENYLPLSRRIAAEAVRRGLLSWDEAMSEAMAGIVEAFRRYDPAAGVTPGAYAMRVAEGRVRDAERRAARRASREVAYDPHTPPFPEVDPTRVSVEEEVERKDLIQRLAAAVSHLDRRTQILLSLRYVEGLTWEEVGKVLGISRQRASAIHDAALRQLRKLLGVE